jgi:hypothetical protein
MPCGCFPDHLTRYEIEFLGCWASRNFSGKSACKIKLCTKVLKMKKTSLSAIFAVCLALSGCVSVLKPTPDEASRFAQHKLTDVPSSHEALIYIINWTSDVNQKIRAVSVKVGDQEKIVEPDRYSIFRVKPEALNMGISGYCQSARALTGEQLKSIMSTSSKSSPGLGVEFRYYGGDGGTYMYKKDEKLFVAEAGKTYFLLLRSGCYLNELREYRVHGSIRTLTEDEGRYLTFKTRLAD